MPSSREPRSTGGPGNAQNWSATYSYDSIGGTRRLLLSDKGIQGGASRHQTYRYDLVGNRQYEFRSSGFETGCAQNGPDTTSFGPDNQIIRTLNSCLSQSRYWHDLAGNRLVQLDTNSGGSYLGPQSVQSYTAKGQLFFSLSPTGSVGTYDYNWHWYDATGQRMLTWRTTGFNWAPDSLPAGGVRTYYVYDGNDVALSIHRTGLGAFAVRARYLVGGVDNSVAGRFAGEFTGPKNLALINDRQGTTLAAMRGDGTQEDNVTYFSKDPFGGLIGATNQGGSMNTETGYAGASTPNASGGFIYLRNRWYDPKTGRFLTQDPIGLAGGVNLYSYAGNNPVAYSDPFGLQAEGGPDCKQKTPQCTHQRMTYKLQREAVLRIAHRNAARTQLLFAALSGGLSLLRAPSAVRAASGASVLEGSGLSGTGVRYVGNAEAQVARSGTVPATNAAGEARVIHFTADAAVTSASEAQATYGLATTPTHAVTFPLSGLGNLLPATGRVAADATQAATSLPIRGVTSVLPLEP